MLTPEQRRTNVYMAVLTAVLSALYCLIYPYLPADKEPPKHAPTPAEIERVSKAMVELIAAVNAMEHTTKSP